MLAGCAGGGADAAGRGVALAPCSTPAVSLATQIKLGALPPQQDAPPSGPIDVYVHILNEATFGNGDIPQQWVDDQIDALNTAYSALGYNFNLVEVTRTSDLAWFNMTQGSPEEAAAKAALHDGTAKDLNIYIGNLGGTSRGWATYPWDYAANPVNDGVVAFFENMPGGGELDYNEGDNVIHEVGHWLGLFHTFENGCSKKLKGDQVKDTEYQATGSVGCPIGIDTCNGAGDDPIHNFMDSSNDPCRTEFTNDQKDRMDQMWTAFREGN